MTSEVREAEYIFLLKLIHTALEINRHDLPNRVGLGHVCTEGLGEGVGGVILDRPEEWPVEFAGVAGGLQVDRDQPQGGGAAGRWRTLSPFPATRRCGTPSRYWISPTFKAHNSSRRMA